MPIRRAIPDVSDRVAAIHYILGSPTHVLVLRHFLSHGRSTRQSIADATNISMSAITRTLTELEERGYLTAAVPAAERTGRVVEYEINRRQVMEESASFFAWLFGGDR